MKDTKLLKIILDNSSTPYVEFEDGGLAIDIGTEKGREIAKLFTESCEYEKASVTELLLEARDLLLECTLIDVSDQCNELVEKIDKHFEI